MTYKSFSASNTLLAEKTPSIVSKWVEGENDLVCIKSFFV